MTLGIKEGCQWIIFTQGQTTTCKKPTFAKCRLTRLEYCEQHAKRAKDFGPLEPVKTEFEFHETQD
jgi:hypothetical protein